MVQVCGKVFKTVLICFFILTGINGCKDDFTSVIPYEHVSMDFNKANYIELNIPGGVVYFPNAGFGGVIVYRDQIDSSNPYLAFDATCTNEVSSTCRVVVTEGSGTAKCPCCGSVFILSGGYGSPAKGPAIEPLKQYTTNFTGGRIIDTN